MRRIYKVIFFVALSFNSSAQAIIKEIKYNEFKFPVIELPDSTIAGKINDYLQTNLLQQTTFKNPGAKVFDKIKWTLSHSGVDQLDYEVLINSNKILSLNFFGDGLGAYPQPFSESYKFNIQNGEVILIEDIFSTQALKDLASEIKQKRKKLIDDHLKSLKEDKEATEDMLLIKESLASCNEEADMYIFLIDSTGIIFHKPQCLPHVIQALDANLDVRYSYNELKDNLSEFGQKCFIDPAVDIKNEYQPSLRKPLFGTIDKYNIVMQLKIAEDNSVDGFYYYVAHGICIEISGYITGNKITLTEQDKNDKITAKFDGTISGTLIKGKWINKKTNKASPFQAEFKK